jgi:hypothetical protein
LGIKGNAATKISLPQIDCIFFTLWLNSVGEVSDEAGANVSGGRLGTVAGGVDCEMVSNGASGAAAGGQCGRIIKLNAGSQY